MYELLGVAYEGSGLDEVGVTACTVGVDTL